MSDKEIQGYEDTDEAICPYCDEEQYDSYDLHGCGPIEEGTTECGHCYREFEWHVRISYSYTTSRIKEQGNE